MQHFQALCATEVMDLEICARCDEVGATRGELVRGRVWPRRARLGHGARMRKWHQPVERISKALEGWRTPRRFANSGPLSRDDAVGVMF